MPDGRRGRGDRVAGAVGVHASESRGVGLKNLGPPRATVSSGCATVFVDQTAKDLGLLDGPTAVGTSVPGSDRWQLFQRSMRPMRVVVVLVVGQNVSELPLAEDQHPVQALATDRAHPPLGIRVAFRRTRRTSQHLDTGIGEYSIEACGELRIAITDQEPEAVGPLPYREHEVAALLGHPLPRRMPRQPENVDPARADLEDEEHVDPT